SRIALNAAGWADTVDNPYLPFKQGMHWTYKGATDGQPEKNTVVVQSYTKLVKGVTCTAVLDRVYINGSLFEKTQDFYAQDDKGNVWYFGEASREIENGKVVSREGSWLAGVNGAKAGIIMPADPTIDGPYYQEFQPGVAEDQAQNLTVHAKARTPFGS